MGKCRNLTARLAITDDSLSQPRKTVLRLVMFAYPLEDQKECLATQSDALKEKARLQNIKIDETISDIGSGMNYKKKGFKKLLALLLSQRVKRLVIMPKDRLLRFGSEILFSICQFFNIEVIILEPAPNSTPTEQLCMDLVEIMTVFTNKIYGMRSHSKKKSCNLLNDQL